MTKKVIIWGYTPHTHTHSYIHYGFAKAFANLDYDVMWYDDSPEYSQENLSDAIIISEVNCCKYLPVNDTSKYFIHNLNSDFESSANNFYNLLVYHENYTWPVKIKKIDDFSWYDESTNTIVIMWATDLLPKEIESQEVALYDSSKLSVNYVGSLSSEYQVLMNDIVNSHDKTFVNYGGYTGVRENHLSRGFVDDNESIKLMQNSYLNFDLRPKCHIENGYIPCRIFKAMSYGCWIGTNSEKILKFFDGRMTACSELNKLYELTENDSKHATLELLKDNQNYIQKNHTYLNRINSLLSVL